MRRVRPELLDSLDPGCPAERANRRDLRRLNLLLGSTRWLAATVARLAPHNGRVVELGAGDGLAGRRLHALRPDLHATAIDRAPLPACWPAHWSWLRGDALTTGPIEDADVVFAGLLLHQFDDAALATLGSRLRSARALAFAEPARRHRTRLWLLPALPWLHPVSRHDARVSIDAGFRSGELPALLGLHGWRIQEDETLLGLVRTIALPPR